MTHIDKKGYAPITIRVYSKEKELLLEDEVLCAYNIKTSEIVAVGKEARRYTDDAYIMVESPTKWGVVAEYTVFRKVIFGFIKKLRPKALFKPKMAVCVPANLTEVESKAFLESFDPYVRKPFAFFYKKSFAQYAEQGMVPEGMDYYVEFASEYYASEYFE